MRHINKSKNTVRQKSYRIIPKVRADFEDGFEARNSRFLEILVQLLSLILLVGCNTFPNLNFFIGILNWSLFVAESLLRRSLSNSFVRSRTPPMLKSTALNVAYHFRTVLSSTETSSVYCLCLIVASSAKEKH